MAHHNCGPARMAVGRCERAVAETKRNIEYQEEALHSNPPNAADIRRRLQELYAELQQRTNELNSAEAELVECEAANNDDN